VTRRGPALGVALGFLLYSPSVGAAPTFSVETACQLAAAGGEDGLNVAKNLVDAYEASTREYAQTIPELREKARAAWARKQEYEQVLRGMASEEEGVQLIARDAEAEKKNYADQYQQRLKSLEADREETSRRIDSLRATIEAKQAEIASLRDENASRWAGDTAISDLEQEIAGHREELSRETARRESIRQAIDEASNELASIQSDVDQRATDRRVRHVARRRELTAKLAEAEQAYKQAEFEHDHALKTAALAPLIAAAARACIQREVDKLARTRQGAPGEPGDGGYDPRTDPGTGRTPAAGAAPVDLSGGDRSPDTQGSALGGGQPIPQPPGYAGPEPVTTGASPASPPPPYPCGYGGYPPCPPIDAPPVGTPWETLAPGEGPRQGVPGSPRTTAPPGPRVTPRPAPSGPPAAQSPGCGPGCHPRRDGTEGCDCSGH
jgi:hypothetical protein